MGPLVALQPLVNGPSHGHLFLVSPAGTHEKWPPTETGLWFLRPAFKTENMTMAPICCQNLEAVFKEATTLRCFSVYNQSNTKKIKTEGVWGTLNGQPVYFSVSFWQHSRQRKWAVIHKSSHRDKSVRRQAAIILLFLYFCFPFCRTQFEERQEKRPGLFLSGGRRADSPKRLHPLGPPVS